MPLHWTSVDTRNAILFAAGPSVFAFAGTMAAIKDQELLQFLKSKSFPSLLSRCKYTFLLANTAVTAPFAYASYLIYKIGGGFNCNDIKAALGLYAATVLGACLLLPTLKKKNMKKLAGNASAVAVLSVATSVTFYTIDKISAYWTMPFTIWAIFCAAVAVKANGDNGSCGDHVDSTRLTKYEKNASPANSKASADNKNTSDYV